MAKRKPSALNLLLAIDKPVGITSHDAVARVRRALGERRVGHAGTLDPLASGVMVVGVGQATRLLGRITLDRKCYLARISFGAETTTDDAEGEITRTVAPSDDVRSPLFARQLLREFIGEQEQVPPAYSAISVDGVRSYKRARAGEEVELAARTIEVFSADLVAIDEADGAVVWTCSFDVSKGTYIRSLARDIGRAAGCAAHIADLRRTSSGCVTSGMCLRIEDITPEAARDQALDPAAVLGIPVSELTGEELAWVQNGRAIARARTYRVPHTGDAEAHVPVGASSLPAYRDVHDDEVDANGVALVHGGELRAIGVPEGAQLAMDLVFPQGIAGVA